MNPPNHRSDPGPECTAPSASKPVRREREHRFEESHIEQTAAQIESTADRQGKEDEFVAPIRTLALPPQEPQSGFKKPASVSVRHRILVADDNEDSASAMAMMLKLMGNEIRTVNDGLEAIEVAEVFRPEAILLDIGMPEVNGYDVCRHIRRQTWGRDVLIAALTGWGQEEDKRRSLDAGFDHHMVKPIDPDDLKKLLKDLSTASP